MGRAVAGTTGNAGGLVVRGEPGLSRGAGTGAEGVWDHGVETEFVAALSAAGDGTGAPGVAGLQIGGGGVERGRNRPGGGQRGGDVAAGEAVVEIAAGVAGQGEGDGMAWECAGGGWGAGD